MIKSRKQMYLVIGAFVLVLMLGTVTYAFFNYTRTGAANTIRTGKIAFNSQQGNSINLTNVFPVDVSNGIPNNNPNVGSVTINVTGDTTYTDGVEYLVSAVNVQNTIGSGANAKTLPISIDVSVTSSGEQGSETTLGNADSDYFTHHGSSAATSIYKVLAKDTISTNDQLVVGYIKSGATGVDGNIVIRAYIDKAKVAISDTYPEETVHTVKTTGYSSSDCETALTGVTGASTYCASASALQSAIDGEDLTSAQVTLLVNAGIVEEYTDGTTSSWVGDREVFTTTEWNSLQSSGISFQVKVEANEGIWVEDPTPPTCPGPQCVYMWVNDYAQFTYGDEGDTIETVKVNLDNDSIDYLYNTNYESVVTSERRFFMGMILENGTSGKITRAFACGINDYSQNPAPFCIEASSDGSTYNANVDVINAAFNVNEDNCGDLYGSDYYCQIDYEEGVHDVTIGAVTLENGSVYTQDGNNASVYITNNGTVSFDPYGN